MDREKVIKEVEEVINVLSKAEEPTFWLDFVRCAVENALELLKEQEPMQVKTDMYGNAYCPWCSTDGTIEMGAQRLHLGTQFCPYCGRPVKWE
jgi:uncharacterized protein (UPF0212 family)